MGWWLRLFAQKVWPTLLSPLVSKAEFQKMFQTPEEREIWDYLVEKPLAALIEDHLEDDTVRGAVFTDAKIGVSTYPRRPVPAAEPHLPVPHHRAGQRRRGACRWAEWACWWMLCWRKPSGAGVEIQTSAEVRRVEPGVPVSAVHYVQGDQEGGRCPFVLFNTSSDVINRCLPGAYSEQQVEGAVFKINMVLKRLPRMKDARVSPKMPFTGTLPPQ
jgi:hypothetical protein